MQILLEISSDVLYMIIHLCQKIKEQIWTGVSPISYKL